MGQTTTWPPLGDRAVWEVLENADYSWRAAFASYEKIKAAEPAEFVISNLIQAQKTKCLSEA